MYFAITPFDVGCVFGLKITHSARPMEDPTLDATNWRAEHALRPAVITRKTCGGGNRTVRGAQTQHVLASILRTAQQRGLDSTHILTALLRAPQPTVSPAFQLH